MPEQEVTIIIVGKDSASKIFKALGEEAKKTEPKVKGLSDKLKDLGKHSVDLGKKLSLGVTAPLAAFAAVSVNSAIKAERLENTLEGLAGGADQAATYIKAIKDASLETIPQVQALEIANRALSFGVVKNADDMAKLTKIAITLGRAQGLDAATAVSDLTTALSRQSPMILDNLGITLKLSEAHKIYADKLGVGVEQLNEAQKAEAFREAALIKGMEVVDKMGGLQDDAAASGERMKAQIADMSVKVGQMLIPVMQTALDVIGPIVQGFLDMSPAMQKTAVVIGAVAAAAGPMLTVFGKLTTLAGSLPTSMKALNTMLHGTNVQLLAVTAAAAAWIIAFQKMNELAGTLEEGQRQANAAIDEWGERASVAVASGTDLNVMLDDAAKRANDVQEAFHRNSNVVADVGIALARSAGEGKTYTRMMREVRDLIEGSTDDYGDYAEAIVKYNNQVSDSRLKIRALSQEEFNRKKGIFDVSVELENQLSTMGDYQVAMDAYNASLDEANSRTDEEIQLVMDAAAAKAHLNDVTFYSSELEQEEIDMIRRRNAGIVDGIALSQRMQAEKESEARMAEIALTNAAAEDTRAAAVQRAADATARARDAANDYADAQGNLMQKLTGATEEIFKQAIFAEIDPHEIGIEAYADLGVELGILDENSAALAESVPLFVEAIKSGQLPIENADEAIGSFYESVQKGNPDFEGAMEEFGKAPEAIDGYTSSAGDALAPTMDLSTEMGILYGKLVDLTSQDWGINITYNATPPPEFEPPTGGGGNQGGGSPGGNGAQGAIVNNNINMTVSDPLTAAMLADQIRQQSFGGIEVRMR